MRSFLLDHAENRESVACNYFLFIVNFVLMVHTLTRAHFTWVSFILGLNFRHSWGRCYAYWRFRKWSQCTFKRKTSTTFFTRMKKFSYYHVFFWNFFLLDFFSCPPNICKARGSRKLSPSLCASSALSFACSFSSFRFALSSCILLR